MTDFDRTMEIFLDVQRGLPRQGPGSASSTRRALSSCSRLPDQPLVLDVGCGPGAQTLVLAEELGARVTAVDAHPEYLDELRERAADAGLSNRINAEAGDMNDLKYPASSFDLVWAEGSAYIMGVDNALRSWRKLLKPSGYFGFSELVWLASDPSPEAAEFFRSEYPDMSDVATNLAIIADAGYEVVDHFTLPDSDWWDHYYRPLSDKLPDLKEKYADEPVALHIVSSTETEIEMRRKHGRDYGYEFFVVTPH